MEMMRAAVFRGDGILEVTDVEKPSITEPDQVIVKVVAASICGSDLHVLHIPPGQHADPGTIMGHEVFGVIDEVGEKVTHWKKGDRVTFDPILKDKTCKYCKAGKPNLCECYKSFGQTIDGGFAQYVKVWQEQLYRIPEGVPSYIAAQTEPLSCVMNGINKIHPTPADNVVVYGMGPIGLTFLRVLKLYGVKNLAVCETSEKRLEKARELGADLAINSAVEDVEKVITDAWGDSADIVIDAVGAGPIMSQAIDLLKAGGSLLLFGQNANAKATISPAKLVVKEITIKGNYCTFNTFPQSTKLITNPALGLDLLVSHKVELEDILKGINLLKKQEASRVIVYPNGIME